jgi:thiol-disulfide isomerase/thioredoxin
MSQAITVEYVKAEWCKVCKVLLPEIEELSKKFNVELIVHDYDDMDEEEKSQIKNLPAITILKGGEVQERMTENKKERLTAILQENASRNLLTDDF